MSSYGSNHSGYHHPSQYPPNPQTQQIHPQPPYPTTPGPQSTSNQPRAFYPPTPQQHQQPMYSSSPASPWQQPTYSSSPQQQQYQHQYPFTSHPPAPSHRRTSSSSSSNPPFPSTTASAPIPIAQASRHVFARPPSYSRSHGSHHSAHMHDHHAFGDGEDGEQYGYGGLDEETLREYERRYAKDRELEKRPTLGGSLMSVVRALGGRRE